MNHLYPLWSKFWRLPTPERRLLVSALFYLAAVRAALWLMPLRVIRRQVETLKVSETFRVWQSLPPARIAWAVRTAGRYVPGGCNCLVQALATQVMLARRGYASQLRLGVARENGGPFKAHAWVEWEGHILIGAEGVAHYTPLPPLEAQRR